MCAFVIGHCNRLTGTGLHIGCEAAYHIPAGIIFVLGPPDDLLIPVYSYRIPDLFHNICPFIPEGDVSGICGINGFEEDVIQVPVYQEDLVNQNTVIMKPHFLLYFSIHLHLAQDGKPVRPIILKIMGLVIAPGDVINPLSLCHIMEIRNDFFCFCTLNNCRRHIQRQTDHLNFISGGLAGRCNKNYYKT